MIHVALAQLNPTVGDLVGNADAIIAALNTAESGGATIAVRRNAIRRGPNVLRDLSSRPAGAVPVAAGARSRSGRAIPTPG